MAFDGVTLSNIVHELKQKTLGGRIDKIYQPEKDEINLNIRCFGENMKLLATASASHPRLHLTRQSKPNPTQAPLFCMVLRKHLAGGKIVDIIQPHFERIVQIHIESPNEMGDRTVKKLIVEIMGKHSNIILTDANDVILDAAKRVSHETSAVREVLPGKIYAAPPNQGKLDPLLFDANQFHEVMAAGTAKARDALYKTYNGLSPFLADELCFRAGVDGDIGIAELSPAGKASLCATMQTFVNDLASNAYQCVVLYKDDKKRLPMEFSCVPMSLYADLPRQSFDSVSHMVEFYYSAKDSVYRVNQKTTDIRKLITQNIERCAKKKDVYSRTLRDVQDREKLKILGELLTANIHAITQGITTFEAENYYEADLPRITIPLDPNSTPAENAQRYFKKYNKQKRTFLALQDQIKQNDSELAYLETLLAALATCTDEADIEDLRDELFEQGFIKKRRKHKGLKQKKSKPLHYVSQDGFHIFVGKNNKQNDDLTLRFAENNDIWLHTKEIPGSHVIIQSRGKAVPDTTLHEAANLAAYYSKAKNSSQVPVDYTAKRHVKKPSSAKPGMVIYDHYQTAYMTPDEGLVLRMQQES